MKYVTNKTKKQITRFITFFIILFLTISNTNSSVKAASIETISLTVTYEQTSAREMQGLLNAFRNGSEAWYWNSDNTTKTTLTNLQPLVYDYGLEQIAMQRAAEIALNNEHTRPDESAWYSCSYNGVSPNGENLASGLNLSTAESALELLKETNYYYSGQGHRRNMLSAGYTAVGIGHVVYNGIHYWVQEFGTTTSSVPSTAAFTGEKDVDISFSSNYISSLSRTSTVDTVGVIKGQTVSVPDNKYNLISTKTWPSNYTRIIKSNAIWTVQDTSIATISNGIITGKTVGTTTISTTVLGRTFTLTLNVLAQECTTHTYNNGVITLAPSCMETGIKTYTCTVCGDTYDDTIAALDHDWSGTPDPAYGKNPTCTTNGYGRLYCARGHCYRDSFLTYYYDNRTIPATGHTEVIDTPATAATCTTAGTTKGSHCSTCNAVLSTATTIPVTGHTWTKTGYTWASDYSTCDVNFKCTKDASHTQSVSATVTNTTTPSTCKTKGSRKYTATLTYNGKTYTDTKTVELALDASNHKNIVTDPAKAATCTETGLTAGSHCADCGKILVAQTSTTATGHTWVKTGYIWSSNYATCKVNFKCSKDATHTQSKDATVNGVLTPSTCAVKGSNVHTATLTYLGQTYTDTKTEELPLNPTAHPALRKAAVGELAPTCTEDGSTAYEKCLDCNKALTSSSVIPALGHAWTKTGFTWAADYSTCKVNFTCDNNAGHTQSLSATVTDTGIPATCTTKGSHKYTAKLTYQGTEYTDIKNLPDSIAALGHSYTPTYTWSDDYSTCKLTLTCNRSGCTSKLENLDMTVTTTADTPASCTKPASKNYKATYNYGGKTYTTTASQEIGQSLGHDYTKKVTTSSTLKTAATYDSPAIYYYVCSRCNGRGTNTFTYGDKLIANNVSVNYHTHIQTFGDSQGVKSNGEMAGTSGLARRLENIWITVTGNPNLGVQYSTHCQTYGWLPWSSNGDPNGTSGESKRLEAIKIQLTGRDASQYDIYYRVHAQSYGWLGWAKNGEPSGTAGYGRRLEGIQIVVKKKGETAPGLNYADVNAPASAYSNQPYISGSNSNIVIPGNTSAPNVMYKTHVQSFGWQAWKLNGEMSGTSGMARRLEGINIKLTNCEYSGGIRYWTHIQTYGWTQGWKSDGAMAGTSGESKRLEAIRIELTGEIANHYDVYYRVHAQSFGWLNWAKNGEESGTAGYGKRLEGIQIILVPKGQPGPDRYYNGIQSVNDNRYIFK